MGRPKLTVLSDAEIEAIHRTSLRILAEIGMVVPLESARLLLRKGGARVDEAGRVILPQAMVEEAVREAPKHFRLCDRQGGAMTFRADVHYHFSGSSCLRVLDYGTTAPRQPTLDDVARFARLADSLPMIAAVSPQVTKIQTLTDLPPNAVMLRVFEQVLCNTTKHCMTAPLNRVDAEAWIEMGEILADGRSLADQPVISIETSPNTPLLWDEDSVAILLMAARKGVPIFLCSLGLAGMSVPITVAGALAVVTAQCLFSLVLAWLANPKVSFIWGALGDEIMDMRTVDMALAGPEDALGIVAGAQMAAFYGFPSVAYAPHTDAKSLDEQVGMEKMGGLLSAIAAGAAMSMNGGALNKSTVASYEQMVIDDEMLRYVYRYLRGVEVSEETLAFEAVKGVGSGGNFMTDAHTLRHLRTGENEYLRLFDRTGTSTMVEDLLSRAHQRVETILAEHNPAVPAKMAAQLAAYVEDRSRRR